MRMPKPKVVVYTCVSSGYDVVPSPAEEQRSGYEYLLFSEEESCTPPGWRHRDFISPRNIVQPNLINRYHKIFPDQLSMDADISVYIDGNVRIKRDLSPLLSEFWKSEKIFGCFRHPQRDTIREEVDACLLLGKFKSAENGLSSEQLRFYAADGFPMDFPLQVATVLFRRHDGPEVLSEAMALWWKQINIFTARDQVSLPYVLWKTQLPFVSFEIDIFNNVYFERENHLRGRSFIERLKRKIFR